MTQDINKDDLFYNSLRIDISSRESIVLLSFNCFHLKNVYTQNVMN